MSVGVMASAVHIASAGTFAVVATSNTEIGASLGTANPIPAPAGVTTGDLLVAACGVDLPTGSAVITASTGWTETLTLVISAGTRLSVFARLADGSGNDTLSLTGPTQDYCAAILRITGHGAATVADVKSAAIVKGVELHPNPPSLDTGANRKWLWLAVNSTETSTADVISAMPASYTEVVNLKSVAASSTSVALAVAQRNLETQTEDPGSFTHSVTGRAWIAATVAIPPGP